MTITDLLKFMGECGARYPESQLPAIYSYFMKMIRDERIVSIYNGEELCGVMAYTVCRDFGQFYPDTSWNYSEQDAVGDKIYIEFLVFREWDKEIRRLLEAIITEKYPDLREVSWLRQKRYNRIIRRRIYEKV